jgi:glycosyltransferase involved in cell wall biosynthesis
MTLVSEAGSCLDNYQDSPIRIAIVVSHPIQYFAPWYRALAVVPGTALKVLFCSKLGEETYYDRDFETEVRWDIPLLDGYAFEFLESRKKINELTFWATDNPGIGASLEKFCPDVVLIHGYSHRTMWRAARWCNRSRVPVMLTSDSNESAKRAMWKRVVKAVFVSNFYRHLDGAFSCGDNNQNYHQHYGMPVERIFAGAMPVDCKRLVASVADVALTRREIRQRHGIPQDAFVVVYAGKLTRRKCPLDLLKAIHRCAQQGLKVWGVLVGEGAERPALEAFIAENKMSNIVLSGFVNQRSIGDYYAASEAVALMSGYEPKGLIVPEAGCFGRPAILSDRVGCIGPHDSARPGENALVYPWSDIDALTECITRLYSDKSLYYSMSESARKIADSQDSAVAALQLKEAGVRLKKMGCRQ